MLMNTCPWVLHEQRYALHQSSRNAGAHEQFVHAKNVGGSDHRPAERRHRTRHPFCDVVPRELPGGVDRVIELIWPGQVQRGDGPRLQPVQLAVPVDGPFQVERIAQPRFGLECLAQQVGEPVVCYRRQSAVQFALEQSTLTGEDEMVRRAVAAHQALAQPAHGIDHDAVALAGDRIGGEDHASRSRVHHALHDHGHTAIGLRMHLVAVSLRPRACRRREAAFYRLANGGGALHPQDRLELARERGLRAVLPQR